MAEGRSLPAAADLPRFQREFFQGNEPISVIGQGSIGGKASGLAFMREVLTEEFIAGKFRDIRVEIPRMVVIATDVFDEFIHQNKLLEMALAEESDSRIANAFQKAELPYEIVGDLRALVESVHQPLAVRSSSLLEDALYEPFAGVYATKMIPNNQPDVDTRFRKLVEAIKLVWASVYFQDAKAYVSATEKSTADEKMAVIIQEVVGLPHGERFYPNLSGVARSYNFYPVGRAKPEDGVVDLALGLGKTIVDGGRCWTYSPPYPHLNPPVTTSELLKQGQTEFWAVNMGKPPEYDPVAETEYLVEGDLNDAHMDDVLKQVASTYQAANDRIIMGIGFDGPRLLDFAPIIRMDDILLNDLIRKLLEICEKRFEQEVEIELAMTIGPGRGGEVRLGFLQVRPMVVSHEVVEVSEGALHGEGVILGSDRIMGNGVVEGLEDIVYVLPEGYEAKYNPTIAEELSRINRSLMAEGRGYLLIGFGRWGSSDPWLGIPVNWGQINGAKVIVEATLPEMNVELSQGSHFFHNICSFRVGYFCVRHDGPYAINWERLAGEKLVQQTEHVRHVRASKPVTVRLDGRSGRGVVVP